MQLYRNVKKMALCFFWTVAGSSLFSCKKDWLNQKPDSNQTVLQSLADFQTLLDNPNIYVSNYLEEVGTDNYYIPDAGLSSLAVLDVQQYLWAYNGYGVSSNTMWTSFYHTIFSCNTILSGLSVITPDSGNSQLYNYVYGAALFWRGFAFNELAQAFCRPYDAATANSDPGIPLRLEATVSSIVGRGSVQQTYDRIINDLKASIDYLPIVQDYKTRPTRWAAYAVLARVYLAMGEYGHSLQYADSALSLNSHLLDYNMVMAGGNTQMPVFSQNPEVVLYCISGTTDLDTNTAKLDTVLYRSYRENDLRKRLFFKMPDSSAYSFKGSYDGGATGYLFSAPAVDELYLIRAECFARADKVSSAMNDLNTLLIRRFQTGTFTGYTAGDPADALQLIVTERRKELVMRMTRWTDLRRLNKDTRFATTITRIYHGQTYRLAPTSNWYVWPIPDDEILYSGITQNSR
jgi:tetratricopeptide (TPR) repeat protein